MLRVVYLDKFLMKTHSRFHPAWFVSVALIVATLACNFGAPDDVDIRPTPNTRSNESPTPVPTSGGLSAQERDNLIAATVQIYGLQRNREGELTPLYSGSGTIISRNGLILTNAHVASPASQGDTESEPEALAVGLLEAEDKPAVFSYLAEVKAVDGFLDLAVLQIVSTLDGNTIDPSDLKLPFVRLGNSDEVHVGDHLNIFGFPGIGGETLTFTAGNVSGFTSEDPIGDRAWIKTDATISGGNSGGLGASDAGEIIGVPTIASSGAAGDITDCRVVQDTNGDGALDNQDTCIPIGGFINALRPVKLALPLIEAAKHGVTYDSPYQTSAVATAEGSGNEAFSEIVWYTVDEDGNFQDAVTTYPSDVTTLVATFDFSGMTDGQAWSEIWTHDGEEAYTGESVWDQGKKGEYYTYLQNKGEAMPEGEYHVELYAGSFETLLVQGTVTVGGTDTTTSPPAPEGEIQLSGTIYDSDTNNGIEGALVIVLKPGLTYDQWNGLDNDILASVQTDRRGEFTLPIKLERNVAYTIVVNAEGYRTKFGDELIWNDQDEADYQFDVALSQ